MISIFFYIMYSFVIQNVQHFSKDVKTPLVEICFFYILHWMVHILLFILMSKLESSTSHLAPFFIFLKILLSLAVFSQVQGSNFLSLSQSQLNFIDLGFKSTLGFTLSSGMILLSSEFISKTSSINHGSLGFFFRALSLGKHVINLSMESMDSRFQAALVRGSLRVDSGHVIDSPTSFNQFHISSFLATVSRVKKSPSFLKLSLQSTSTSISQSSLLSNLTTLAGFILIKNLNIPM